MNSDDPIPAEQKTTAQQLIATNVQALIDQLEAGNSDALTAYLDAMSRFHRYSFGNVLSIARQRPGATRVAGFHAWRQLGRNVKKGERGIRILAPIISKRRKNDDRDKDMPSRPSWPDSEMPMCSMSPRPMARSFPPYARSVAM